MTLFGRLFGASRPREGDALYRAVVAAARDPIWYREGQVPDTIDGRFDMVAAVTALALARIEQEGAAARADATALTERFIDDMEGSVREIGVGDQMVGKHVGRMVGALGGRLGAFRSAGALDGAVRRNLFRESPPSDEAVERVARRLERFRDALTAAPYDRLRAGELPKP